MRADSISVPIEARQIAHFKVGSDETKFGKLTFMGGLELTSSSNALGAMSAIRLSSDRSSFLGVMDTGDWYAGQLVRDAGGRMTGVSNFTTASMMTADGQIGNQKWKVDAEGLAIEGDRVLVSFERVARIDVYPAKDPASSKPVGQLPIVIPVGQINDNRGLEVLAVAPSGTSLDGAAVTVTERSLNKDGNLLAAVLEGPKKGVFYVKRNPPFDATDGAFLPNGDLLLLERRFSISGGIGMRIRRIAGDTIKPGATVDGEVLLDADFGYQIDNMEGLDAKQGADGNVYLTLVSDDNHSILQRNLILEFRLDE